MKEKLRTFLAVVITLSLGLAACGPAATPEPEIVKETVVVDREVLITATAAPEEPAPPPEPVTLYLGGTMSLTGPYAEDTAAVLAGYEDYAEYVNETKNLAP